MNSNKILIVEDEVIIAKTIQKYLLLKDIEYIKIATSYKQATEYLNDIAFDLVLLDINLNESKTGIDIASLINRVYKIPFIFISSYFDDYTINLAKVTYPSGFITKPINKDTLFTTIQMIDFNSKISGQNKKEYLIVSDGKNTYRIKLNEIQYIKADHVYVQIFVKEQHKPYLIRNTLNNIEQLIKVDFLIRIHRTYIVNKHEVESFNNQNLVVNGIKIPIGSTRKEYVLNILNNLQINI